MKVFLQQFNFSGVKNIKETLTIDFYKKVIPKEIVLQNYNVKALYGANGVGKSAVVLAMSILQGVVLEKGYLNKNKDLLDMWINQASEEMIFEARFLNHNLETDARMVLTYFLKIKKNQYNEYVIAEEKLSAQQQLIFHIVNGQFKGDKMKIKKNTQQRFLNTLSDNSIICSLIHLHDNEQTYKKDIGNLTPMIVLAYDFFKVTTLFDEFKNEKFFTLQEAKIINLSRENLQRLMDLTQWNTDISFIPRMSVDTDVLPKDEKRLQLFLNRKNNILQYLKFVNPDIIELEFEVREREDAYFIDKHIIYAESRVPLSQESDGLKKWFLLLNSFIELHEGGLVFIDDLFTKLHDSLLTAVLQYFIQTGDGQLVFTTHNLLAMDILKKQKKAIDFITREGKIVPWIKNGNHSILKSYRKGLITGVPMSISEERFEGVFDFK